MGGISIDKDETFLTLDTEFNIGETGGSSGFVHDTTADAFQVNGVTRIDHLFVGGVTFSQNQTFSGVTYETVTVKG